MTFACIAPFWISYVTKTAHIDRNSQLGVQAIETQLERGS